MGRWPTEMTAGRRPLKLRLLAIAALAAAVVGAGCGDDESSAPSGPDAPRDFFAVVPQAPVTAEDLERMGQGGVGTMRSIFPWAAIDHTPADDFDFSGIDPIVLDAARNDVEVLPFLFGTPNWVSHDLDGREVCEPDCATYAPRSPEAVAAWSEFVGAAVDRYGPNGDLWKENPEVEEQPIRAWQIWNEQNSPTFYQPAPDVEGYSELVASAADAIRARDPNASIVLGGMFGTPLNGELPAYTAWDFLGRMYEGGAGEYFDGVAVHPYAANLGKVESQIDAIHDEIGAADDDATLWVTEIGWASGGPDVPLNRGEEGQAEQLTDAYEMLLDRRLSWDIETVAWYSWRDTIDPVCDWCTNSGLFPAESLAEPKPSWEAFTALTGGS